MPINSGAGSGILGDLPCFRLNVNLLFFCFAQAVKESGPILAVMFGTWLESRCHSQCELEANVVSGRCRVHIADTGRFLQGCIISQHSTGTPQHVVACRLDSESHVVPLQHVTQRITVIEG